jgi:hypothetical protein
MLQLVHGQTTRCGGLTMLLIACEELATPRYGSVLLYYCRTVLGIRTISHMYGSGSGSGSGSFPFIIKVLSGLK